MATITVTGYGGLGQVVDTLPEGFAFKESSLQAAAGTDVKMQAL